jgi:hypothetical protein
MIWAGTLQCSAGVEKMGWEDFLILNSLFLFDFSGKLDNNWKKYLGTSEKCEILHGDGLAFLSQLLNWAF